jgi:tRNA-2-methylthio-N6-dimethylallyladenosine synthase
MHSTLVPHREPLRTIAGTYCITDMDKRVYIHTFGCQMNVHDTEKMFGVLMKDGYQRTECADDAHLIILNTCSIRQKAEQKFYSELGRLKSLKKRRAGLMIAVAGCIAQQEGDNIFRKAPHVDFVFGPQNIHLLSQITSERAPHSALQENPAIALHDLPADRTDEIRAWISIMYGCNNFCSYCVVPYTRGRERSRPSSNILTEVSVLAEKGCKEVTLLGQNVNSYESEVNFPGLLRKLSTVDGIRRIRFVTSHPKDLSGELIQAIADLPKVCEHIHLPLQSGSDYVLNRMNRRYTLESYMQRIEALRGMIPGISITSDIIAGFPGESDRDHTLTMQALEEICFDGIFAFAFSARPHTMAATYECQMPEDIKLQRLNDILKIQDDITLRKNIELEGTVQEILVEGASETDKKKLMGKTRTNKIVTISNTAVPKGSLIDVQIVKARKHSLEGIPFIP